MLWKTKDIMIMEAKSWQFNLTIYYWGYRTCLLCFWWKN